ncbi:Ig-like domain-containing protein [soil metagenome]
MRTKIVHILAILILYSGCANITTPNGGPKDIAPPKKVSSIPEHKQKNFAGKTVEITFNEYVKFNNPKEEIIISPSPGKEIEYKIKQNKVSIKPKDGWQPETTYSILFREGIKDFTEGNVPPNLKLAFSTGPTIDSLAITGRIFNLLKGTAAEKITVAIFAQDTFDIFVHKPSYFTKTDKQGSFTLENLKAGTYTVYAFDDKNKNLKVESRAERYGFLANKIDLTKNVDSIKIGLISLDARPLKIASIRNAGAITRVRFNKSATEYLIDEDTTIVNTYGDNQTELLLRNPPTLGDSIQIHLTASDSLLTNLDSTFYIKKTAIVPPKETFKWSIGEPTIESETGKFTTKITFNKPLSYINFDSLYIERDTVYKIPISKTDITIDEHRKEIIVLKNLDKKLFKAETDPIFNLKARPTFLRTLDSDTSKAITKSVPTIWPEDTGTLIVEVKTTERNYLIQLLDGDNIVASIKNPTRHIFKFVKPTTYQLRIIIDSNSNGKWDPGNYYKRIEPEKAIFYSAPDGKQTFPIRANWELGPLILRF